MPFVITVGRLMCCSSSKDNSGQPCGWSCKRYQAITDALTLEGLACREAILLATAKGFDKIILEGDCQVLINTLNKCIAFLPMEIQDTVKDVLVLSIQFTKVSFSLFVERVTLLLMI
ncbi:hypothetical protein P3X46_034910 [Hevea brasiliensis]|uniref:RNase H type-1 domain-containing protein n=1 Tax=Hevea brasiliensis TaxID=3981 RepID=A0ABQ9KA49_HEVBR|nr:hypothetical protein P3X46_034910 [Hevea brasiliensis]